MEVRHLIPKNKGDYEVIGELKKLSFDEIKPIIPDLLEWLQDINWPIAKCIAEVLEPFADNLTPYLLEILETNDGIWKLWILTIFGRNTENEIFLKEIVRIAKFPTLDEIEEEVNVEALAILNGNYN